MSDTQKRKPFASRSPALDRANRASDLTIHWIGNNPTVAAPFGSALLFAVISHAYRRFYASFGVTLPEVGLGYGEIVLQSPTFLVICAVATAYLVALILMVDVVVECTLDAATARSKWLQRLRGEYRYS